MRDFAPRQAVVVIHGIGEQEPMQTLRAFVDAVAGPPRDQRTEKAAAKPDHLSPTLELRRMAVPGDTRPWEPGLWVSTDFYELYWAHLMTGTAWHHVTAWIARLLLQNPKHVPPRLKTAWWVTWAVAALAGVAAIGAIGLRSAAEWSLFGVFAAILLAICRLTGTYFGLQYAGDAARYLSPWPENVAVRQAIRSAAIELLEKLHDDSSWRRYHRIVVVGHSLGSVIAYDALTHLWQRRHHAKATFPLPAQADAVEDYEQNRDIVATPAAGRDLQAAVWREQRAMGIQWKITDLITLGSPLAHASFLLASGKDDLGRRKAQREFPTCPPQPNDSRDQQYGKDLLKTAGGSGRFLHHAAPFASTRWTNLYFDRDIIGGSIEELGTWIDNRPLDSRGVFPHTKYWQTGRDHTALNCALNLVDWWKHGDNLRVAVNAQQRETLILQELGKLP
jgi:hypothetical protein